MVPGLFTLYRLSIRLGATPLDELFPLG